MAICNRSSVNKQDYKSEVSYILNRLKGVKLTQQLLCSSSFSNCSSNLVFFFTSFYLQYWTVQVQKLHFSSILECFTDFVFNKLKYSNSCSCVPEKSIGLL